VPWRISLPLVSMAALRASMGTGVQGSRLVIVKPGVVGSSTKSPAVSVSVSAPSTDSRQLPSSSAQKLGRPNCV